LVEDSHQHHHEAVEEDPEEPSHLAIALDFNKEHKRYKERKEETELLKFVWQR
jgi:hypothetical protein